MMTLSQVEDQLFNAVQGVVNHYAPAARIDVRVVEPQVKALANSLVAGAEVALRGNTITGAAAAIGTTLGTAAGTAAGTAIGGPLGTALGATAGAALGGVIGTALGAAFSQVALSIVEAEAK